tara:strand:+ start:1519 stop:3093 length:1575 start_codon:yes stop_codon:yes gene_type:complete
MQEGGTTTEEEQPQNRKITTDQELMDEVGNLAAGNQGGVPQVNAVLQKDPKDKELLKSGDYTIGTDQGFFRTMPADDEMRPEGGDTTTQVYDPDGDYLPDFTGKQYQPAKVKTVTDDFDVTTPVTTKTDLGQVGDIERVKDNLPDDMQAAQIEDSDAIITDDEIPQGEVSDDSLAVAQTEELDERATTRFQLGELMSSIEEGKPMPPWASPAVRKVSAMMQARGMGASSMAAAAMTQAVMESGVVIANQDANKYATIQLKNLDNKQKTALQNALTYASMDRANLNARLQAAVTNAQVLLTIDTKNLDAQQQTNAINYNALTQAVFKDAAEENAKEQFNAKNEMQVEQFFAELEAQVETANANRNAAVEQFNVGQENATSQFNASLRDSRQKFDANMQFAVDQSNVVWRRAINTADTATQNETNRINTQNLFNASQNALNTVWQAYRDNASWNFQKSENLLQRNHELGVMAMEFANSLQLYDKEQKDNMALAAGTWIANWIADSSANFETPEEEDTTTEEEDTVT